MPVDIRAHSDDVRRTSPVLPPVSGRWRQQLSLFLPWLLLWSLPELCTEPRSTDLLSSGPRVGLIGSVRQQTGGGGCAGNDG